MIKCDRNKKRDTITLLWLCPHRGLLELSIFVNKITMHYILKIYLKKSILLLFFTFVYIIPHFLIFFNIFIFFQKFQTKKFFYHFYSIKSILLTTFQKIFSKSAWLLEKERVYYVCKGKEVKKIMVRFYKKRNLRITEVTIQVNIIIFKFTIKLQPRE